MPSARLIASDSLMRWATESFVAVGMRANLALKLAAYFVQASMPNAKRCLIARLCRDLADLRSGSLGLEPRCRSTAVAGSTFCVDDIVGHPVFASQMAFELATRAAVVDGIGGMVLSSPACGLSATPFLRQIAREGFGAISLWSDGAQTMPAVSVALPAATADGLAQVLGLVPDLLQVQTGVGSDTALVLVDVLNRFCFDMLELPPVFRQPCTRGLQALVMDPSKVGFALDHSRLGDGTIESIDQAEQSIANRQMLLDAELVGTIEVSCATLRVSEPFVA